MKPLNLIILTIGIPILIVTILNLVHLFQSIRLKIRINKLYRIKIIKSAKDLTYCDKCKQPILKTIGYLEINNWKICGVCQHQEITKTTFSFTRKKEWQELITQCIKNVNREE